MDDDRTRLEGLISALELRFSDLEDEDLTPRGGWTASHAAGRRLCRRSTVLTCLTRTSTTSWIVWTTCRMFSDDLAGDDWDDDEDEEDDEDDEDSDEDEDDDDDEDD